MRLCPKCKDRYSVVTEPVPSVMCPKCGTKGMRVYDRLTIIAGRRFGKTAISAIAAAEEACIPNTLGWACAPTNEKLHRYVIPAFQAIIPESWVAKNGWSIEHKDLRLKNGSLIHFQTLEHPDQGRGQGLDWLYIDEIAELTKLHWDTIRPSLAGDMVAFFTTTPRGFDWVYEELFMQAVNEVPGYWAVQTRTVESANPKISKAFLDRERETMGEAMFKQEYEADFVTFTGSIYGDHLKDAHILRTDADIKRIIPTWPNLTGLPVLIGLDAGADHPFAAVKLVSTEHGLVVVGEYLARDRSFGQHATFIKRLAASLSTKYAINRNDRQGIIELAQHGILAQSSNNDQVAGIQRVVSWLEAKQLFFVESTCVQTLRQMKSYRWAEHNISQKDGTTRKEKVHKKDDDLMDGLRYAMMAWPTLPKPQAQSTERDISKLPEGMQHDIRRLRKMNEPKDEEGSQVADTQDFWG